VKPRLLDLFCCEGGAARGYADAGFEVVGVDIEEQPRYPFEFIRADALEILTDGRFLAGFDAVHASPTCQRKARVTAWRGRREDHPNTLTPTLAALRAGGIPYVVENVPEAADELRPDFLLCGTQFGLKVRRHRIFERGFWSGFELLPRCTCYRHPDLRPFEHKDERAFADALGGTWMTARGGRQAIPPAFTRFIGDQLMTFLRAEVAA
jgi:DNA (cytosine-5)-methyltransferase 1